MNISSYITQAFAWHALLAGAIVAVICGLIGPFVIGRKMAFAVHGTSELAFTGAAAGLLIANNPLIGAFAGAIVVATILGLLGNKVEDRDSSIGVILAFGLGVGVLLLNLYRGYATQATNILFGNIFGISSSQLMFLLGIGTVIIILLAAIYRPLLFASVDPEVARARGIPVKLLGIIFLYIVAISVTAAAQVVGTLLVLSLAITPAAAAQYVASRPTSITALSVAFALIASVGGIMASLASATVGPSIFVTGISFAIYVIARLYGKSDHHRPNH